MLQNANGDQQYDTYAKAFLGRKDVIAWILVNVLESEELLGGFNWDGGLDLINE